MITLTKFPANGIAFTDMPLSIILMREGIYTTKGEACFQYRKIDHSALPSIGAPFQFIWQLVTFNFLFGFHIPPSAPENTLSIPIALPGETMQDYCTRLARAFNEHEAWALYFECRFIVVDASGDGILLFIPKKTGTDFSFSITSASVPVISTGAAVDAIGYTEMSLLADVKSVSNIWRESKTATIELNADGSLNTQANISEYKFTELHKTPAAWLDSELPHVAFGPMLLDKLLAEVQANVFEVNDGIRRRSLKLPNLLVLAGGVSLPKMRDNEADDFIKSIDKRFLTELPKEKTVKINQPEWLSFILSRSPGVKQLNIIYTVYYSDGSDTQKTVTFTANRKLSAWCIPAGYINAKLEDISLGRTPVYYTVLVEEYVPAMSPLPAFSFKSETRTYIIETGYEDHPRFFVVRNTYGGWDTFRAVGDGKFSANYVRNSALSALTEETRQDIGTLHATYSEEEQSWTMRTGWLMDKAELDTWRQLLLSKQIFEVGDLIADELRPGFPNNPAPKRQDFRALVVKTDSVDFYEESEGMWALEWEMSYAHKEIHYGNSEFSPVSEYFTDSEIEMTCTLNGDKGLQPLRITVNANYAEIWVNGVKVVSGLGSAVANITTTAKGVYKIVVKAYNLTHLYGAQNDNNANAIITRIHSATLEELWLFQFRRIEADYLRQRIPTLYSLRVLTLSTVSSGDWGASRTEAILQAIKELVDSPRKLYFQSVLLNSTGGGTTVGAAIKNHLTGLGYSIYA